jgi:phage terminase large subunit GpA-like protein
VATSMLKSELYGWLKLERPTEESGDPFPPGYCHIPQMDEEFFKQLTAEQLMTRIVKGYRKSEWEKIRERNEALDCRIYARAAAAQFGIDRFNQHHWQNLTSQVERRNEHSEIQPETLPISPEGQKLQTPPPSDPRHPRSGVIGGLQLPRRSSSWLGDRTKNWWDRY